MITTTLAQLLEAQPALERLAGEKLPVKTAYGLAKLLRLVRPEIQQFTDQRNSIIRELGTERQATDPERAATGQASMVEVTVANREAFVAQINDLASIEVRLEVQPIEIAALDGVAVTAVELLALDPFLVG